MKHVRSGHSKLMSLARYLVSVREGRFLTSLEQVDHIDGDCSNDSIGNLQILTASQNCKKKASDRGQDTGPQSTTCPYCGIEFFLPRRILAYKKRNGKTPYCSRQCSGKASSRQGHKDLVCKIKELRKAGKSSYTIARELGISRNTVFKYW